jgi:hypothetical protein
LASLTPHTTCRHKTSDHEMPKPGSPLPTEDDTIMLYLITPSPISQAGSLLAGSLLVQTPANTAQSLSSFVQDQVSTMQHLLYSLGAWFCPAQPSTLPLYILVDLSLANRHCRLTKLTPTRSKSISTTVSAPPPYQHRPTMGIRTCPVRTVTQLLPDHCQKYRKQLEEKGTVKKNHTDFTKENIYGMITKWTRSDICVPRDLRAYTLLTL